MDQKCLWCTKPRSEGKSICESCRQKRFDRSHKNKFDIDRQPIYCTENIRYQRMSAKYNNILHLNNMHGSVSKIINDRQLISVKIDSLTEFRIVDSYDMKNYRTPLVKSINGFIDTSNFINESDLWREASGDIFRILDVTFEFDKPLEKRDYSVILTFENGDIQSFIHPNIYKSFVPIIPPGNFGIGFDFNRDTVETAIFRDEKISIKNNSLILSEINKEFCEKFRNTGNRMSMYQQSISINFDICANTVILVADEKHDQFDVDYHFIRCVPYKYGLIDMESIKALEFTRIYFFQNEKKIPFYMHMEDGTCVYVESSFVHKSGIEFDRIWLVLDPGLKTQDDISVKILSATSSQTSVVNIKSKTYSKPFGIVYPGLKRN